MVLTDRNHCNRVFAWAPLMTRLGPRLVSRNQPFAYDRNWPTPVAQVSELTGRNRCIADLGFVSHKPSVS